MIEIPPIGLGTWKLKGDQCVKTVSMALDLGYRHIDTAFAYENHEDIAKGIKGFDRQKLFLTSKISLGIGKGPLNLAQIDLNRIDESVSQCCDRALKELNIDYLDLMMIHWPSQDYPIAKILKALQKGVDTGKIRYFGCCNCTIHHLKDYYREGARLDYNQVEFHPYLNQEELLQYGLEHGTYLIGYRPFGKGQLTKDEPRLDEIGENYGKSGYQVILRWLIQKEIPTIPKAGSQVHLKENLDVFDFQLSKEDMDLLNSFNQKKRYCVSEWNEFDY